jgi:hypothetical protein
LVITAVIAGLAVILGLASRGRTKMDLEQWTEAGRNYGGMLAARGRACWPITRRSPPPRPLRRPPRRAAPEPPDLRPTGGPAGARSPPGRPNVSVLAGRTGNL